jgi:predicted PurR-regulated permease PerM
MNGTTPALHWLRLLSLIILTIVGLFLAWKIVEPVVPALTLALTLSVLLLPIHSRIERRFGSARAAASLTVALAAALFVVPVALVGQRLITEMLNSASFISSTVNDGAWQKLMVEHPNLEPSLRWFEKQASVPQLLNGLASWLSKAAASFIQISTAQLVAVVVALYVLFYLLRDREKALAGLAAIIPLSDAELADIFARIANTIRGTLYGTVAVAIVQGSLGGLMFWWLGLPTPLFWGIVMGMSALVPVLGAFIIWIPASISLFLIGEGGKALILILWGTFVVGGIDNLLYPILVGNQLSLHTIPTFISLVGGVIVFGPVGLILGPIVLTVTIYLLELWRKQASGIA